MNHSSDPSSSNDQRLPQAAQLSEALKGAEEQRDRLSRGSGRQLLIIGVGISILCHLCLMYYLSSVYRFRPAGPGPQPVSYEFAILQEEELTEFESIELDDLIPEAVSEAHDLPTEDPAAELDPVTPAAELEIASSGSLPTFGGSGGGTGAGGLGGGGAGASFFGVSSRGMRFAYIVDHSGSMGQDRKMAIAMHELARSIDGLPDYASFFVVLFSSGCVEPPMQEGWMRARKSTVNSLIRWLNRVDPTGGTQPECALLEVFSLTTRPDVIFFLTDGEIPGGDETADLILELNRGGGRVIINTIAFGDARSQGLLRRIARESGGVYRFVATGGE